MAFPVDVRDLLKSGARLKKERDEPVRLAVLVELDAPDGLIETVKDRLRRHTDSAFLRVEAVEPGKSVSVDHAADAVIGLVGSGDAAFAASLAEPRDARIPTCVLALGVDEATVADALGHPLSDALVGDNAEGVVDDELASWLVDRLPGKRLSLAHNFAFVRRAVAEEAVKTTAWQNALIGGVAIIPGADMPLMTANQAKMLLQIAAAFGEPLGPERIKEIAAIVGGGLTFRAVARQALTVVPGFGWAVKGGVGYAGTVAMGRAVIEYFEQGADLRQVAAHLREAAADASVSLRESPAGRRLRRAPRQLASAESTGAGLDVD